MFLEGWNINMKKKKQSFRITLQTTKYMFDMVWRERDGKVYILLKCIMSVLNALFPVVYTIVPGLIVNELVGQRDIQRIIAYVALLTLAPVVSQILNLLINRKVEQISLELDLKFEEDFYEHVLHMDYEILENPEIQVKKERAGQALDGVLKVMDQLSTLLLAIISMLAISTIIATLNPFIIVLIVGVVLVNSHFTKKMNQKRHRLAQELSRFDNNLGAYTYMLEYFCYAKEIRLFRIQSLLIKLLSGTTTESNKLELKYRLSSQKLSVVQAVTDFIQQAVLYSYLIYCVFRKNLAIGSMTIYLSAAGQFSGALSKVFNAYLGLADRGQKTKELMEFLSIPLKQHDSGKLMPQYDKNSVIEFCNVSFRYPGSERYALKNLNLTIRADEKLCIVGVNGSGKSTFVKLLTRLYFPSEGEILLNGININEYDYESYQRLFAPVFQDFCEYYMSIKENIILASPQNDGRLQEVCEENGLKTLIEKLPKQYDTQVGKWFDEEGFAPSGGEGQRIAIARACYHDGKIFLLDEPTAALDPLAEYEIYTQFNNMIANKTAILITHRLSAVQLADKVAVFAEGSLAEYGTHQELYDKGGLYKEMFDKQAQFYRDEN